MEPVYNRRSTYTFLIIFLIVLGIVGTLVLVQERQEPRIPAAPGTAIELIPAQTSINQGDEVSVDVMLRPAGESIKRAEVTLNFDKAMFEGISFIQTGSSFINIILPGIVGNDSANIVLETNPATPASQDGVIARLTLKVRNPGTATVSLDAQTKIFSITGNEVAVALSNTSVNINRTVNPETILYFSPSSVSVSPSEEFSVDVYANSGNNQVAVVDVIILYDTNLLEGLNITTSTTLPTKLKMGSFAGGKATFNYGASATGTPPSGTFKINTITFRSKQAGNTSLTFSTQSLVLDPRSDENMLKDRGALIINSGTGGTNIASPNPSPSGGTGGTCTDSAPLAPTGVFAETLSTSQIRLSWNSSSPATYYGIVYGTSPGSYKFGAANVGNVTSYTVGSLAAGTPYYFAVFAVNNCAPSGYSTQVAGTTDGGDGTTYSSPVIYPSPDNYVPATFVPLDETVDPIEFLTAPEISPSPYVEPLPTPTPEGFSFDSLTGENPLLSPLGGILLIIAAIFVGIFFFRMR